MNLFELQERLKDFSQEQLVREMQAPTGSAPQFLVLSELQRRQRMMAEEQAQMQTPQTTVAEDAIAAAGVPQGGLADMARSMAPQTDMDMNTAVQPVERMRDGGVVRMRPGGLARSTGDPELDAALAELERQRLRQAEVLRSLGLQGDEEGLSGVSADVGSYRPSPISAAPMTSAGGLPNIRETQNLLGRIRPSLARQLLDQGAPPSTEDSVDAVRRRLALMDAREDEGPYTEALRSDIERQRRRLTPDDYQSLGETDPLDPRSPSYVPPLDTSGAYADLLGEPSTIEAMFGDVGPLQGPMQPELYSPAGQGAPLSARPDILMRISPDVLEVLNELGIDPERFAQLSPEEQQDILGYVDPTQGTRQAAAESYDTYVPPSRNLVDVYTETLFPGYGEAIEEGQRIIRDREAGGMDSMREARRLLTSDDAYTLQEPEEPRLSFGDQFGDVDPNLVRRGGTDELTFGDIEPTGAPIPFALPIGEDQDADADVNAVVSGGGGAAAPAVDDAFEQDKWLALAQAGLALMSSQQPTIGGAIGEAGLAGITALRQARGERDERIERQQARADRLAAAAARGEKDTITGTERAAYFRAANEATAQAAALELALERGGVADDLGIVTPYTDEEKEILQRRLNDARTRANRFGALANPALVNFDATLEETTE
jgi:hypothetical protein